MTMTTSSWIKRGLAAAAVSALALIGTSSDVKAGTANGTFEVRVQVNNACTLNTAPLVFPNYTSGQSIPVNGSTQIQVVCPGATALPVTLNLTTGSGSFEMTDGANFLAYTLYTDAGMSTPFAQGVDVPYTVTGSPQPVDVFGEIAANLTPPSGNYAQTVTATLTF